MLSPIGVESLMKAAGTSEGKVDMNEVVTRNDCCSSVLCV